MEYSFWNCPGGRTAVSRSKTLPGPVEGYVLKQENGCQIEGDESGKRYATIEEAAKVRLKA
jgi:hypothetical protein